MNTLSRVAALAALVHITPTVVLVKRPDAVQRLLPGADQYFARELHLSSGDAHKLHGAVDWSPDDGVLTFYTGKTASGKDAGALLFIRVDTPHGPVEVAVSFAPDRTVRGVIVTKATVETKPWVLEALNAGVEDRYRGLTESATPAGAAAVKGRAGELAVYIAGEVDKGVARALVAYHYFYRATT